MTLLLRGGCCAFGRSGGRWIVVIVAIHVLLCGALAPGRPMNGCMIAIS
jgi:hypothetical protein